jgi:hypothetical protein
VDPAHGFFSSEIYPKFRYFGHFALKSLGFSKINPQSIIFTKRSLASEKFTKIAPKLQKFISFQPQLQI